MEIRDTVGPVFALSCKYDVVSMYALSWYVSAACEQHGAVGVWLSWSWCESSATLPDLPSSELEMAPESGQPERACLIQLRVTEESLSSVAPSRRRTNIGRPGTPGFGIEGRTMAASQPIRVTEPSSTPLKMSISTTIDISSAICCDVRRIDRDSTNIMTVQDARQGWTGIRDHAARRTGVQ